MRQAKVSKACLCVICPLIHTEVMASFKASTDIGYLGPYLTLKQDQGVLQGDRHLSDWDSDSEDEDLLDDGACLSAKHSYSNAWAYARLDPKEYLHSLIEGLMEDFTLLE